MKEKDCRNQKSKEEKKICKSLSLKNTKLKWLHKLTYGSYKNQLINIWLSIFAVNARKLSNPYWVLQQIKSINDLQFSNYEKLIFSQITNPGLLTYLNAFRNKKNNPNENLGRELLELYTVGEGNFSEDDVKNTSLALTGLFLGKNDTTYISKKFKFQGETLILGKKDNFTLKSLINWLVQQPSTAENISKRFCNYLLGEKVETKDISEVIKDFQASNLDLKVLYSSLSKNKKYLRCQKYGTRLIDPISLVTKSIALIGSKHQNNYEIGIRILKLMGQPFLEVPNPEGWPFGEEWISTSRNFYRKKGLTMLLSDEEIWDTRNTPAFLSEDLVPFEPFNINLPAETTRENIAKLFTDPSWNFNEPINLNF